MVVLTLRLFPAREQRRHVLGVLRSVQGPTQAQPDCLSCRIFEEDGYEEAILYIEKWDSEPALHRHIRSELYRRILSALELSRIPPEIQFHYVSETKGIDLIESLRAQANGDHKSMEPTT
jgi:quinol monooxygenase YgiN